MVGNGPDWRHSPTVTQAGKRPRSAKSDHTGDAIEFLGWSAHQIGPIVYLTRSRFARQNPRCLHRSHLLHGTSECRYIMLSRRSCTLSAGLCPMVEHLRFQFLVNSDHCLKIVVAPLMRGPLVCSAGPWQQPNPEHELRGRFVGVWHLKEIKYSYTECGRL